MILGTHAFLLALLVKRFLFKTSLLLCSSFNFFFGLSVQDNLDIFPHNWAICFVKKGIYFNYSMFLSKYSSFFAFLWGNKIAISCIVLKHFFLYRFVISVSRRVAGQKIILQGSLMFSWDLGFMYIKYWCSCEFIFTLFCFFSWFDGVLGDLE